MSIEGNHDQTLTFNENDLIQKRRARLSVLGAVSKDTLELQKRHVSPEVRSRTQALAENFRRIGTSFSCFCSGKGRPRVRSCVVCVRSCDVCVRSCVVYSQGCCFQTQLSFVFSLTGVIAASKSVPTYQWWAEIWVLTSLGFCHKYSSGFILQFRSHTPPRQLIPLSFCHLRTSSSLEQSKVL